MLILNLYFIDKYWIFVEIHLENVEIDVEMVYSLSDFELKLNYAKYEFIKIKLEFIDHIIDQRKILLDISRSEKNINAKNVKNI